MESNIPNAKSVIVPKGPITLLMTKNGPIMILTNNSKLPSQKVLNETKQSLGIESTKALTGADQCIQETGDSNGKININKEPKEVVNILTASATERNKSARAKMLIDGLQPMETLETLKPKYLAKDTAVQWIKRTTECETATVTSKSNILTAADSERNKSIRAKRLIDSLQQVESTVNEKVKAFQKESGIHWVKRSQQYVNSRKSQIDSNTSTGQSELENGSKSYPCHKCGAKFSNLDSMMTHFTTHRNERLSTPPAKKVKASSNESLKIKETKQIAGLNCPNCKYKCNEKESMENHMKIHADEIENPFSCDSCGERFTLNTDLMEHMKGHASDKVFSCPTCERKFTQKHSLLSHLLSHVGDKPFSCSVCDKEFFSQYSLNRHKKNHIVGERECKICSKTFQTVQIKRKHMKMHENEEEKYICGVCDTSYQSKSDLLQHLSEHTENDEPIELFEESFLCPYCEDVFLHRDDLIKHFESVHV